MDTQMVRTTISLPKYIVDDLKRTSLQGKSFGDQISELYHRYHKIPTTSSLQDDFAFFDTVRKTGKKIDAVRSVREERDRDAV